MSSGDIMLSVIGDVREHRTFLLLVDSSASPDVASMHGEADQVSILK